jgi:hypothetical protein
MIEEKMLAACNAGCINTAEMHAIIVCVNHFKYLEGDALANFREWYGEIACRVLEELAD